MRLKKITAIIAAAVCLCASSAAFAGTITGSFEQENTTRLTERRLYILPVVTIDENMNFDGLLNTYNVLSGNEDDMAAMAHTLGSYVARDKDYSSAVFKQSFAPKSSFSFDEAKQGMYLLFDPDYYTEDYRYASSPQIAVINEENSVVKTVMKEHVNENPGNISSKRTVTVKWNTDTEFPATVPDKISVQVLKNGKVDREVSVSKNTEWKVDIDDLNVSQSWNIIPSAIPDGFAMIVRDDGRNVFIEMTAQPKVSDIMNIGSQLAAGMTEAFGNMSLTDGNSEEKTAVKTDALKKTDKPKATATPAPTVNPSATPAPEDAESPKTGDSRQNTMRILLALTIVSMMLLASGVIYPKVNKRR